MLLSKRMFAATIALSSALALAMPAPKAARVDKKLDMHGDVRVDPYYWLQERQNPKVLAHLREENAYADAVLQDTETLQKELFAELKGRLEQNEQSAPYSYRGYAYYTRTEGESEYPIYCRRKGAMEGPEEILIDGNERARGTRYFSMTAPQLSPDERYLAYAVDTQGRRFYTIELIDRKSGKLLLSIEKTTGVLGWAADGKTLLYARQDPETLRSYQVLRRDLSAPQSELVYEESDPTFEVVLSKSRSEKLFFISSNSTTTSEVRFLPSDQPKAVPTLVQARSRGLEYAVEDGGDRLFIRTNWKAKNFQLMEAPRAHPDRDHWQTVVAYDPKVFIEDFEVFADQLVLVQRENGLTHLRLVQRKDGASREIPFQDAAYVVAPSTNAEYQTDTFLYSYQSLTQARTVYAWDFAQQKSRVIKETKVNHYDPQLYTSERVLVKVRDGALVPVSLVYKKGLQKNGRNPTLLYGYGSYGISIEPSFASSRISLLDRGFVYAIAHIRGGAELGRAWYENGKLLQKKNSFQDFIDCSQWLVDQGYTTPDRLFATGRSAGGLLMGAVVNMRPDLYKGVIAGVPFVDVVTTMLDASLPLTTAEYDEWGDPRQKEFYDYMKSYSPYDNVSDQKYPSLLVRTGFQDSQVQYWEPAKWVVKLRDHNKADTPILLKTNFDAGHGGASGRFASLKDVALEYAFLLKLAGWNPSKARR